MLDLKSTAPNIESIDQNGQTINLSNWIGDKYIVLFFYPKDFTPGCVKEACGFAREYDALCENGEVEIIGVSGDATGSHQKFADTYGLPFSLISDKDKAIRKAFEVPIYLGLLSSRVTYIIDKQGKICFAFEGITKGNEHVSSVVAELKHLTE